MNVAVADSHRRRGVASAMLERLFALTRGDAQRGYTLEVRVSNVAAIGSTSGSGSRPRVSAVVTTLTTERMR